MAIGGFTGSDPAPTLAQFKAYVAAGDITYYIAGGGMGGGPGGGSGSASQITSWVEAHFTSVKIGGQDRLRPAQIARARNAGRSGPPARCGQRADALARHLPWGGGCQPG